MKNKALKILQIIISGGLLFYVLKDVNFLIFLNILTKSNWVLILLTLLITNIGIILSSYKLKLLLNSHDFKGMIKLTYIGTFLNFCLPGTISGDAVRIGYLKKNNIPLSKSTAAVFLDRGTGFVALITYLLIGLFFCGFNLNDITLRGNIVIWIILFIISLVLLCLLLKNKKIRDFTIEFVHDIKFYIKNDKKILLLSLTIAFIFQFLSPLTFFMLLYAVMGANSVPFLLLVFVMPLINIISLIPISIQGIGIRESLYLFFFKSYGVTNEIVISLSLIGYAVGLLCGMIGFYYLNTINNTNPLFYKKESDFGNIPKKADNKHLFSLETSNEVERKIEEVMESISNRTWFSEDIENDNFQLLELYDFFGNIEHKKILDIGCAKGRFVKRLVEKGAIVTGIDLSERLISEARKNVPHTQFIVGSATKLPFNDELFDCAYSIETFEHIPDTKKGISEACRVLKKGGKIIIIDKHILGLNPNFLVPNFIRKPLLEKCNKWVYPKDFPFKEKYFVKRDLDKYLALYCREKYTEYLPGFGLGPKTKKLEMKWPRIVRFRAISIGNIYKVFPFLAHYISWKWEK